MQNVYAMRPEVRAEYAELRARADGDAAFLTRLERFFTELRDPLVALYGDDPRFPEQFGALLDAIAATTRDRDAERRRLDHEREITPDWLQREQAFGYVCYVDRFAGTLAGVRERLAYLRELGVNYLHLMPLLAARPEPNDGGYAVADYGAVEPSLGTMEDLRALAADLRAHGMTLCVDVVLNHTAREHAWARAALAGDERKLAYYRTFADRSEPDEYERTLPEVFPGIAPSHARSRRRAGTACAGSSPRARRTRRAPDSRCGRATITSTGCYGASPAIACWSWRISAPTSSRSAAPSSTSTACGSRPQPPSRTAAPCAPTART